MEISTTSQPRAKRKLDRAQPQEEGRHRSCAAPILDASLYRACASRGASAECQSKTTGSRPWLKLYRRSAAKTFFSAQAHCRNSCNFLSAAPLSIELAAS